MSSTYLSANSAASALKTFTFDDAGQLTSAAGSASESFAYDANGNRTTGTTIGEHNRLEEDADYTYQYDNEGNLTRRTDKVTGDYTEYTWDHRNRLVGVDDWDNSLQLPGQSLEYRYSADGQLVYRWLQPSGPSIATETHYVYDGVDRALTFDGATDELANRYVHGPQVDQVLFDEVFDHLGQQDELFSLAADHLGTTRAVLNDAGNIVQAIEYDSFGNITELRDANGNPTTPGGFPGLAALKTDVLFAGRLWDNEAQLYNNNARWYEPTTGRFLSQDPIEEGSNWYRYAGNDPVNFRDPTGLSQAGNPLNNLFGGVGSNVVQDAIDALSRAPITVPTPQFNTGLASQILGTGIGTSSFSPVSTFNPVSTSTISTGFTSPSLNDILFNAPVSTSSVINSANTFSSIASPTTSLASFSAPTINHQFADFLDQRDRQGSLHSVLVSQELQGIAQAQVRHGNTFAGEATQIADIGTSVTPLVSDVRDVTEVLTGRDAITGERLSGFQRTITAVAAALPIVPAKPLRELFRAAPAPDEIRLLQLQETGARRGPTSNIAENSAAGSAREIRVQTRLEARFGAENVLRQRTLLDAQGRKVIDPVTGTGRRVDVVVTAENRTPRFSVEVTSRNQVNAGGKRAQIRKESRIRDAGGTFIRDPHTGQLVDISNTPTRLIGVEPR